MNTEIAESGQPAHFDIIIVGAGMAGIYAVHRLRKLGVSVLCIDGAPELGGVWYYNGYPGARVDVDSTNYCYFFDRDLYSDWRFQERNAAQPELLEYLNHVADRFDLRRDMLFESWVQSVQWIPASNRYNVQTDRGGNFTARFVIAATGQLSKARAPDLLGLDRFGGDWYQTSNWPRKPVAYERRRVAIIGTGSTGVQAATVMSREAEEAYVFQRTAHYSLPARNEIEDPARQTRLAGRFEAVWAQLHKSDGGMLAPPSAGKTADFTEEQLQILLETRWAYGGISFLTLFSDTAVDPAANKIVADFVRGKIRHIVNDPSVAQMLTPSYPIGVRRPSFDTGYYDIFNQHNVTLVDIKADPISGVTPTGIQMGSGRHHDVDLIVLALGFESFTGSLDRMNITNESGASPTDNWKRGPRTYLGMMMDGFPNLFNITGPGSPSVLSNFFVSTVHQIDFIAELIQHMAVTGLTTVEPSVDAVNDWTAHCAEVAQDLLRRKVPNYMTHINQDDGSRVMIPYAGGFGRYVARCAEASADGYKELIFS